MFKYDALSLSRGTYVALPAVGSLQPTGFAPVVAQAASTPVGTAVHLVGRTSGHSQGTVIATCVDVNVATPQGMDSFITNICQDRATYASGPGDSGGAVFVLLSNGSLQAVGIHLGTVSSSSVFSRISFAVSETAAATGGQLRVSAP